MHIEVQFDGYQFTIDSEQFAYVVDNDAQTATLTLSDEDVRALDMSVVTNRIKVANRMFVVNHLKSIGYTVV